MPAVMTLERPQWGSPSFRAPQLGEDKIFVATLIQQIGAYMDDLDAISKKLLAARVKILDQGAKTPVDDPNFNAIIQQVINDGNANIAQMQSVVDFKNQAIALSQRIADALTEIGPLPVDLPGLSNRREEAQQATQSALLAINSDFVSLQQNTVTAGFNIKQRDAKNLPEPMTIGTKIMIVVGIGAIGFLGYMTFKLLLSKEATTREAVRSRRHAMAGAKLEKPRLRRI